MDKDEELTHSPETEKYFEELEKAAKRAAFRRKYVNIDSGAGWIGIDRPSTFAGSITQVDMRRIYYTSNEIEDNSQQEMTRTLSKRP